MLPMSFNEYENIAVEFIQIEVQGKKRWIEPLGHQVVYHLHN